MFAHKKNYGRAAYVDDPLPNIHCAYCYLGACLHCMALLCIRVVLFAGLNSGSWTMDSGLWILDSDSRIVHHVSPSASYM